VRSILRFAFVVVPTAVLAAAVVVGVSLRGHGATAMADGDLQRDLTLASAAIELAPAGQALATVSSLESAPAATPKAAPRPKRARSGARAGSGVRAVRSRAPVVRAAAEPEVAESLDESEVAESTALAPSEGTGEAPAESGGVALPRPTAIPVSYPAPEAGAVEGDSRGSGGGSVLGGIFGTVLRGGGVNGDHCQIHGGRGTYSRPRSRGVSISDRVRRATSQSSGEARTPSSGTRVREATRTRNEGSTSSRSGSMSGRVRAATRR
jgi:hypothetical protein